MGGSRVSKWLNYRNLFITMALGGLWHGAGTHFLLWGAYQGALLVLHKEYSALLERVGVSAKLLSSKVYHVVSVIVTFHLACLGWVLFRADTLPIAGQIMQKLAAAPLALAHFSTAQLAVLQIRDPIIFPSLVLILPLLMISHVVVNWLNDKKFYQSPPWAVQVSVMVVLMCVLTIFSPDSSPKFIYFQF
jgi:D-alanyl-lipoteichoic acid acyltransferase DltB (MBOAT superfamily)